MTHLDSSFAGLVATLLVDEPSDVGKRPPISLLSSIPPSWSSDDVPGSPSPTPNSLLDVSVQLPEVVGVKSPSSALWKSPKSPNDSKEESSSEKDELKVTASLVDNVELEKGPKSS